MTDFLMISHPSTNYSQNLIEMKDIKTDKLVAELVIPESEYPFSTDGISRIFGVSLKA